MKILLFVLLMLSAGFGFSQEVIPLYKDKVPGVIANASIFQEEDVSDKKDGVIRLRHITTPTLEVYIPKQKKSDAAVIICPGGGYRILAYNHEGTEIAQWYAQNGITAFVLKYRLPQEELFHNATIRPLEDAQNAIYYVRANAETYQLSPSKIGIMGFSAGGHLAATASNKFKKPIGYVPSDSVSLRPDFSILMYPVISFADSVGHIGSRENLSPQNFKDYSNELLVTEQTPPAFLVHAADDFVSVENSLLYAKALKKNNIKFEMHVYDRGGHGFALKKNKGEPYESWPDRLLDWLKINRILDK